MHVIDSLFLLYTAISINVVGSKHKARRQDRKVMWDFFPSELINENQLCSARTVKIYDGEPFGWKKFQDIK